MRASYRFQDSSKLISNWSVFLPLHDSNPAVAVVGGKNIVIAVDKTVTEPRIPTNIVPLDDTGIILAYIGYCRDAPFLVKKVQLEIEECERFPKYSFPISPQYVACKVADVHRQLDCLGRNPYFLLTLIVGFKPCTLSPELWVADPSGMVRKCPAHAIGRDFELRNEFLRKNYNYQETSVQSAVNLAIRALLEGSESGEKKIEVTVKTREHGLTQFKQAEIDAIVAEIEAEKVASEKEAIILLLKSRSRKQLPREQLPKKLLPREQLPRKLLPRELLLRRQLPRKSKKSCEKN